jgi:signal recognition particle GTPase
MKIIQRIANFYLEEEKNREIRFKEREENRLKAIQEEKERKEKALAQNTTQFEVFFEEQCEDYFQHLKMIFSQHRQRMEVTASHVEKILQEVTAHARKNRVSENSIPKSLNDFMPYILRQEFFFSDKRFRNYENFIEYLNSQKASA